MNRRVLAVAFLLLSPAAMAQDDAFVDSIQDALEDALQDTAEGGVGYGTVAVLRGLDKVDGQVIDMSLPNGINAEMGRLSVELIECRYPVGDNVVDAYALMTIRDISTSKVIFSGWMLASSPALNALEHPRYDVWVLRCKTE